MEHFVIRVDASVRNTHDDIRRVGMILEWPRNIVRGRIRGTVCAFAGRATETASEAGHKEENDLR
jgi:hypothetical protein